MTPGLDDLRLAAGDPALRLGVVRNPDPLDDGRMAASLVDTAGANVEVAIFGAQGDAGRGGLPRAIGPPQILAGPDAEHPVALPDGRILFRYGSFRIGPLALHVMDPDGTHREPVPEPQGMVVLNAKPLVATTPNVAVSDSALDAPRASGSTTFAYHALNLFAGGPVDAPLPPALLPGDSLRVRILAVFEAVRGGDSTTLIRDSPVRPDGSVQADSLPVGVPLLVELVAPDGRVLLSAHGFGRTAWVNARAPRELRWFNAASSAEVTASSSASGTAGPRAAVDRRTRGSAREVAWISASPTDPWLKFRWPRPLEIRELALHGLRPSRDGRVTVRACEVVLRLKGTELSRRLVNVPLGPEATHVGVGLTVADEVEIRFLRVSGLALGKRGAALAEVEAIALVP
jgi:hypothetical protein